ncbi:MAG: polysaccharide deacetylase family protein [Deltaproteobacteria bacterium]
MMKPKNKLHTRSKAIPVLIFVVLIMSSCTGAGSALRSLGTGTPEEETTEALVFQSKDYLVYRLESDESPARLAERFLKDRNQSWVIEDANNGIPFKKGRMVVIPLKEQNKGGLRAEGYQVVPVLCYHHFDENCHSSLCTPISLFEGHMRYLKEEGYRVIPMRKLLGFLNYGNALPKRAVVLTIDDGYRSAYDIAYPILKKYGFTATLFIYTDFVEASASALTWDHLRARRVWMLIWIEL